MLMKADRIIIFGGTCMLQTVIFDTKVPSSSSPVWATETPAINIVLAYLLKMAYIQVV